MESYNICPCDWVISLGVTSSRFIHVVSRISIYFIFLKLNYIPLYMYTPHFIYLFIHWWSFGLFPSTFWLLWIMLQWRWVYKYLSESQLSILLGIQPEVELMDYTVILCLIFLRNDHNVFTAVISFYFPTNSAQVLQFLHILANTCFVIIFFSLQLSWWVWSSISL